MDHILTLADAVATHARLSPQKIGVMDTTRSLTFRQWQERASRLGNGLLDLGLKKGDRVALLAYNCIEWMEMYVGLSQAGLVAVPINFRLSAPEIAYIIKNCGASACIVQDTLSEKVDAIRHEVPIASHRYIYFGSAAPAGYQEYEALIDASDSSTPPIVVEGSDTFALLYTSGTTGRPKGAIRNHAGNAQIAIATALEMGFTRNDRGLLVMPMCHANSIYFCVAFVYLGATVVIDNRKSFDPEALIATLANERITFTSLVPTHYVMILELPAAVREKYDVSAVAKLMISSAPARKELKLAIMDYFENGKLHELYGSTELGWVTLLRPEEQLDKLGSVGREWACSGAIKMLGADGNEVPDGEVGELHSRTPYVFDGYWDNPEKTTEAFAGKWCSVGDMARRDSDGYIYLVDRKSNMIISGGENIYPSEVEYVIASHTAVKEVAVIGMPDIKWGEFVQAIVVLYPGQTATEAEILGWCRDRLAGFKRPRTVVFVTEEQMPRTATGKIQHRLLRDQLLSAAIGNTSDEADTLVTALVHP
ncbi:class I adenylate-forming enzyme family protein [Glaciimonas immobilis]|uniref:Acyl-CoA synthetase (AMP-forming)/AMP-acid ligase II n=1 Tax=Glaciimonas immobilis TaxID=728004 RepID=A0A840RZA2_9BURK|nr:AMP-binding protein [Glaciimonas immobilis]KAF3996049.1 AMP-binding protein [Glaciimonas immobilis]MBB5201821.1 acyl-CoA synthetase (AMP-forming)/AMP-acid ligase II [Glaciimonas immobilis]